MQRFDINEGFPNRSSQGIEPYISESFVLFHENGNMIPLERGFGKVRGLSQKIAQGLKRLQHGGYEITGEVHPFFISPINIEGDMEFYRLFPVDSAGHRLLTEQGVNLTYDRTA